MRVVEMAVTCNWDWVYFGGGNWIEHSGCELKTEWDNNY